MNVGEVQEHKLTIGKEEYTFRLDFNALIKFNERYKDYKTEILKDENGEVLLGEDKNPIKAKRGALDIFNDFLKGVNQHDCIVKMLSCACVTKDFTEEELKSKLSFDFPTIKVMELISRVMINGSFILQAGKDKNEKN